jgi:hypothetical protein
VRDPRGERADAHHAIGVLELEPDPTPLRHVACEKERCFGAVEVHEVLRGLDVDHHAVATDDFIKLGKEKVEGTILAAGSMLVIDDVPAGDPIKKVASTYMSAYEKQFGARPATFGANTYDAGLLLQQALPMALKVAKPGTEAFRVALRDALERRERAMSGSRSVMVKLETLRMVPGESDRAIVPGPEDTQ